MSIERDIKLLQSLAKFRIVDSPFALISIQKHTQTQLDELQKHIAQFYSFEYEFAPKRADFYLPCLEFEHLMAERRQATPVPEDEDKKKKGRKSTARKSGRFKKLD